MNAAAGVLLGAAVGLPLVMLLACLSSRLRARMPALLAIAPVPALAAALLASGGTLALPPALLRLRFALDVPGALLLGVAALLWIVAGIYASAWLRGRPDGGRFVVWWLLTLSGSVGVFMAADLVSFYLVFSMVSLAAYGLIVDDGTPRARRSGLIYVALALLGEAFLLMAFVLLAQAATGDGLLIRDATASLPTSPWRAAILTLLILGFGAKIGLVPFHIWMPLAYRAAPIPAAAVLSGAAVKAGVIGLIRFLPLDASMPEWGEALAAAGLFSAFYGVAIGITQRNPKTVLAYSSVSQMGVIATVFGMGLAAGNGDVALFAGFYAAHHTLVKGALFLAIGVAQATGPGRQWPVLLPAAILALGLGGLPLTGGALAKLVVKAAVGSGVVGLLMSLSSAGTALLMLHFLRRLAASSARDATSAAPARLSAPWLATAVASVAVPWAVYVTAMGGTVADSIAPTALWSAVWPLLLGGVLAIGLWRWGSGLLQIPGGDIAGVAVAGATRLARIVGLTLDRLDRVLRQWPVAGVSLLALAVVLALALGGCASLTVADTKPLPETRLEPPGSEHISAGGYRLDTLAASPATPDLLIIVAMSGGGKRSAAFSYGALKGLRDLPLQTSNGPRPLLGEIDAIAGVSGGSFTAAYYGLHRDATFGQYETDFLYRDTEANIWGIYLLPWNWTWLIDPLVGTNDFMERVYDRDMFHGARFADLKQNGRPIIAIGGTDIAYGSPFLFTQETFDLICSDLDDLPIARAVAASNGFPGLLSSITLTNHAAACDGRKPGWLRRVTEAQRLDPRSRIGNEARGADRYLDNDRTRYVHLVDGGVSDNLALRATGASMLAISQSPEKVTASRLHRVRRVLVLSIDGQGAQDTSVAQQRVVGGIFAIFRLVSGIQIDRFNFETLAVVDQQLQQFVTAIKQSRCSEAKTIDGAPCDDVDGDLVHVSLAGLPDSPAKQQLLAIRTGLTLRTDDVDSLIEAGRTAILDSTALRDFLNDYAVKSIANVRFVGGRG